MPRRVDDRQVTFNAYRVADAMTEGVIHCRPTTSLREVARIMTRERVHAVYVVDDGGFWSVVSDADLVAASLGDVDKITAQTAAVTPLLTIHSDESLTHAAELLAEHSASHLAVLDPVTKQPCGVLSTLDIARVVADAA